MAAFLLVNPRAGDSGPTVDELIEEAGARGIQTHVVRPGEDAGALARSAEAEALGMAGGDGSLRAVAQVAVERSVPFVCVPFGTRNHFARDIGLDRDDPIAALDAFASERERMIDVGTIDGGVFLNNVSVGVYARLVHRREAHRRRRDAFARMRALAVAVRSQHPEPIVIDGTPVAARVLLVANNAYELDLFNVVERERLDDGKLHAYLAQDLLPRTWEERVGAAFTIGTAGRELHAAVDGEPVVFETPVALRISPQALRIRLPERQA